MFGKSVSLHLDKRADSALNARDTPLLVEMELLFSCFIAKRIHFKKPSQGGIYIPVNNQLQISFTARIASSCSMQEDDSVIHNQIESIKNLSPYVPKWCSLVHTSAGWSGQFGYDQQFFN